MRPKVLHVITGLDDGGAEGVLTRLCLNSEAASHVVISLKDGGKYGPLLKAHGVAVHSVGMNTVVSGAIGFFRLLKLIREEKPQVVQTWLYHADLLGGLSARLLGIRKVFWNVRLSYLRGGNEKKSTLFIARLCAKFSAVLPERVICCAEKALQTHLELGYKESKLVVIPNGYDLKKYRPEGRSRALVRNEFGVSDDEVFVGMIGRFHPAKDHHNLFAALGLLKEAGVAFRCLLAGIGIDSENWELASMLETYGLSDYVTLAGQRMDVPALMNGLDIHILSSRYEGFPNVVAEAMACGTPCVSTDVGDAAKIIGDSGVICPASDPKKLKDGILMLANESRTDEKAWEHRINSCRERILNNFSLEKSIALYEGIWGL